MATQKKASVKKKGTYKSALKTKRAKGKKTMDMRVMWHRLRIVFFLLVMIVSVFAVFLISRGESAFAHSMREYIYQTSAYLGFRVENIIVKGRRYTDADALLALINMKQGDPILSFDPAKVRQQVEKINWVKAAHIERRLPDTIYVKLEERTPFALWENGDQLSVIDEEGHILTYYDLDQFKHLIMVRGVGAGKYATSLFSILKTQPDLEKYIDHAVFIDQRRWNLYLTDGKYVKLPEKKAALALATLVEQHRIHNILNQEAVRSIDLRYQGRLIVRTKLGRVQDYKMQENHSGVSL